MGHSILGVHRVVVQEVVTNFLAFFLELQIEDLLIYYLFCTVGPTVDDIHSERNSLSFDQAQTTTYHPVRFIQWIGYVFETWRNY